MIKKRNVNDIDFEHSLYSGLSKSAMLMEQPDEHVQWVSNGNATACLSIWWADIPNYKSERTALIGHFNCVTAEDGEALLLNVKDYLFEKGINWIVGPINGSSWFSYRLALDPQPKPAFLFEPWQPATHLAAFKKANFEVIEHYVSNLQNNLDFTDPRTEKTRTRLLKDDIHIRNIDPSNVEAELQMIYQLSLDCFADNLFYRPIDFATFAGLYRELLHVVPPPFCKLAFHNNELVGILFTYPDNRRLIVKTSAVKSTRIYPGLSIVLMDDVVQVAKAMGLQEIIFALMHTKNKTVNSTTERSQPFRHYGLMGIHR